MSATAHLIPKPGLLVADPTTLRFLPVEGAEMPLSSYWLRRLQEGDVVRRPAVLARKSNLKTKPAPVSPATAPEAS
ncbi:DUF2635 domain-containing protein [Pseudoxanthomonas sp. UTMC 1351]|uniref:DUF2635 domain-containing protein n=1 Tax=Pseudoxanthomonas sp. UTMC 1351 TaxID=2695853 RepID=UPI0034CDFE48